MGVLSGDIRCSTCCFRLFKTYGRCSITSDKGWFPLSFIPALAFQPPLCATLMTFNPDCRKNKKGLFYFPLPSWNAKKPWLVLTVSSLSPTKEELASPFPWYAPRIMGTAYTKAGLKQLANFRRCPSPAAKREKPPLKPSKQKANKSVLFF